MVSSGDTAMSHSLLSLVESLQSDLTNEKDAEARASAVKTISDFIARQSSELNKQEIHFLSDFLCARLNDSIQVIPAALQCSLTLFSNPTSLSNMELSDLVRLVKTTLAEELYVQSFTQPTRLLAYKVMIAVVKWLSDVMNDAMADEAIKMLGSAEHVILQIVRMVDGEKDPRNLLYCFHLIQLISSWNKLGSHLSVLAEELFEVYSCYFPIEFADGDNSSGPDGSLGISKSDLVDALLSCFASTPKYAEFAIPFFLHKLTAEVIQCKVDSLEALTRCSETYLAPLAVANSSKFDEYTQQLWHGMFSELITSANELVLKSCYDYFKCLLALVVCNSTPEINQSTFMKCVLSDCNGHFRSVATKTHKLTLNILKQCLVLTCNKEHLQFFNDEVLGPLVKTALQSSHEFNKCISSINTLLAEIDTSDPFVSPVTTDLLNRLAYFVLETFQNTVNKTDRNEDRISHCLVSLKHLMKIHSISHSEVSTTVWSSISQEFWKTLAHQKLSCFDKKFLHLSLEVFRSVLENSNAHRVNEFMDGLLGTCQNGVQFSLGLFLILLQLNTDGLVSHEKVGVEFKKLLKGFIFTGSGNNEASDVAYLEAKVEDLLMTRLDEDEDNHVLSIYKELISNVQLQDIPELFEPSSKVEKVSRKVCQCLTQDELHVITESFFTNCQKNQNPFFSSLLNSCFIALPEELFAKFTSHEYLQLFVTNESFGLLTAVCLNRLDDKNSIQFLLQKWISSETITKNGGVAIDGMFKNETDCEMFLLCCHALIRRGGFKHFNSETKSLLSFYLEFLKNQTWGQVLARNSAVLVNGVEGFDPETVRGMKTQPMFVQQLMYNLLPQLMNYKAITEQPTSQAKANWLLCLMTFLQSIPENLKTKLSSFSKNNSADLLDIIPMALTLHPNDKSVDFRQDAHPVQKGVDPKTSQTSSALIINSALTLLDSVLVSFLQLEQQSKVDSNKLVTIHQSLLALATRLLIQA